MLMAAVSSAMSTLSILSTLKYSFFKVLIIIKMLIAPMQGAMSILLGQLP